MLTDIELNTIIKKCEELGIYFAKDLVVDYLDIFTNGYDEFVKKFEDLKNKLGSNYVEILENDSTLWESLC